MLPYSQSIDGQLFDSGKKMADAINQKIADHGWWEIRNKFMAFSIADGSTDNVLYDNKKDAVRHQKNNERHFFFMTFRNLGAGGAKPRDCAVLLKFARDVYKAGFRFPDPDSKTGGPTPVLTTRWNDFYQGRLPRMTRAVQNQAFWLPGGMN